MICEPEEKPTCDCCRYPAKDLRPIGADDAGPDDGTRLEGSRTILCGICAGTKASKWHEYRRSHGTETMELMRTICYIGNKVIDEIGRAGH